MRELILQRIEELRKSENGFTKSLMRWQNFFVGESQTHISKYNFDACPDEQLVKIFESLIRRMSKQM